MGRLNPSTTRATADPFQLTASTPRDVVFAQAAALQQKYSARAAAEVTAMTPRTKGTHSGALMRAKTAKSRRVSGGLCLPCWRIRYSLATGCFARVLCQRAWLRHYVLH